MINNILVRTKMDWKTIGQYRTAPLPLKSCEYIKYKVPSYLADVKSRVHNHTVNGPKNIKDKTDIIRWRY
jgi:hypothetical protein